MKESIPKTLTSSQCPAYNWVGVVKQALTITFARASYANFWRAFQISLDLNPDTAKFATLQEGWETYWPPAPEV